MSIAFQLAENGLHSTAVAASRRRRGPSLARRTYQAGSVFQKGRSRADRWETSAHAYGRFWQDVPGINPRRTVIPLGVCRTRSIAERKCAEHIEKLGINSAQNFVQSTSTIKFRPQGELWLKSLANRKRNPVEQTTIDTRRYALDKWIYPLLGDMYVADVNNLVLKKLVEQMAEKLSAASIRDYSNIVKAVVASAIDENGEEVFPRKWNEGFLDLPTVKTNGNRARTSKAWLRSSATRPATIACSTRCLRVVDLFAPARP